jgi:hypothetical protein
MGKVIVLGVDADEVSGAHIEAEKHSILDVVRHRKTGLVMAEIAAKKNNCN